MTDPSPEINPSPGTEPSPRSDSAGSGEWRRPREAGRGRGPFRPDHHAAENASIAETERLFAALGEDIPEFEPTDWEFAAEEELIWFSGPSPKLRRGLRDDILIEFDRADRQREFGGKLTVAASLLVAAALVGFGPREDASRAESIARIRTPATERFQSISLRNGPPMLVEASQDADSWALVDAYSQLRERHSSRLTGEFNQSR